MLSVQERNKVGQEEGDKTGQWKRDRREVGGESAAAWCGGRRPRTGDTCTLRQSRGSVPLAHGEPGASGQK